MLERQQQILKAIKPMRRHKELFSEIQIHQNESYIYVDELKVAGSLSTTYASPRDCEDQCWFYTSLIFSLCGG